MTAGLRQTEPAKYVRNPELLSAASSRLLIVDVQEKLLPPIPNASQLVHNCRRLLDGAKVLAVPVFGTEQYPQGLGPMTAELAARMGPRLDKVIFSCARPSRGVRRATSLTIANRSSWAAWRRTSA